MKEQNFSNHTRYVPGFHFLTFGAAGFCLVLSVRHLIRVAGDEGWMFTGLFPLAASLCLFLLCWYSRAFALKAQDRAIRAEENFRHYILTGKPLPALRLGQIVALRFASDAEFPALAQRAVAENLSSKQIKQSVQNWRADHNRV